MRSPGGIFLVIFGIVLIGVLVGFGGDISTVIQQLPLTGSVYHMPGDTSAYNCYEPTVGYFNDSFWFWNLTNLDHTLAGGKPNFNLVGTLFSMICIRCLFLIFFYLPL